MADKKLKDLKPGDEVFVVWVCATKSKPETKLVKSVKTNGQVTTIKLESDTYMYSNTFVGWHTNTTAMSKGNYVLFTDSFYKRYFESPIDNLNGYLKDRKKAMQAIDAMMTIMDFIKTTEKK